jgi:hypothetical protein
LPLFIEPVSPPVRMENPPFLIGARPGSHPPDAAIVHVTTQGSAKHRLILYLNVDQHCAPAEPVVRSVNAPKNGALSVERTKVIGFSPALPWPAGDPRSKCRLSNTLGTSIDYTPVSGFIGHDLVVVEIEDNGHAWHMAFEIDVLPRSALQPEGPASARS